MLVREIVVYVVVLIQFLLGVRIPPCRRRVLGVIVFVFSERAGRYCLVFSVAAEPPIG